ncbi:MAG: hypothetical protein HUJ55_02625 [Ileibacterium sp.]|nr:hypothetical protein [Ileibacterium sp.]
MCQPVVFLDIDGVIRAARPSQINPVEYTPHLAEQLAVKYSDPIYRQLGDALCSQILYTFDKEACRLIDQLCSEFQASIVISSSWRIFHTLEELQALLKLTGIEHVCGVCPSGTIRRDIIRQYIRQNRIRTYIVIDDMDLTNAFGYRFVHTPSGFEKRHYEKARYALLCQIN